MITAKEARKRIDTEKTERAKQEKKIAEKEINKAVEQGRSYCWLGFLISEATEEWLKSLGYKVNPISSAKHSDVEVSW